MTFLNLCNPLGVVPILFNAGSALLPSLTVVFGPVANVVAVLFKPRQLVRTVKAKPWVGLVGLGVAAGLFFAVRWAFFGEAARPTRAAEPFNWVQFAEQLIEEDKHPRQGQWTWGGSPADTRPATGPAMAENGALVFRHGFDRCGYDGGAAPVNLKLAWPYKILGAYMFSSPLVASGRVYSASCLTDATGAFGAIFCLDAATGTLQWSTDTMKSAEGEPPFKPFFSSPALSADGKRLVIGQGLHADKDSSLICLNAETGVEAWHIQTPLHIEGSPAIFGDIAYAGAGAIEGEGHRAEGDPGFVLAVRISDGKELWRAQVNDPESSPAVGADGVVYIGSGFNGNAIVALRPGTDAELAQQHVDRVLWKRPVDYPVTGAVTLYEGLVIVGAGKSDFVYSDPRPSGCVVAADARTGEQRWKRDLDDSVLGAIAARDGKLICPVRSGDVVCLDAKDGNILWRRKLTDKAALLSGPACTGNLVYQVTSDGFLFILNASDGAILERKYVNDPKDPGKEGYCLSSPWIAGGRLFVGSETGGVCAFEGEPKK